jgi:hypothetical protein
MVAWWDRIEVSVGREDAPVRSPVARSMRTVRHRRPRTSDGTTWASSILPRAGGYRGARLVARVEAVAVSAAAGRPPATGVGNPKEAGLGSWYKARHRPHLRESPAKRKAAA